MKTVENRYMCSDPRGLLHVLSPTAPPSLRRGDRWDTAGCVMLTLMRPVSGKEGQISVWSHSSGDRRDHGPSVIFPKLCLHYSTALLGRHSVIYDCDYVIFLMRFCFLSTFQWSPQLAESARLRMRLSNTGKHPGFSKKTSSFQWFEGFHPVAGMWALIRTVGKKGVSTRAFNSTLKKWMNMLQNIVLYNYL